MSEIAALTRFDVISIASLSEKEVTPQRLLFSACASPKQWTQKLGSLKSQKTGFTFYLQSHCSFLQ